MERYDFETELAAIGYLLNEAVNSLSQEDAARIKPILRQRISAVLSSSLEFAIEQSYVARRESNSPIIMLGMDDLSGYAFPISPAGTDPKIPFKCMAKCPVVGCTHPPSVVLDARFLRECKCPIHHKMMELHWK